MFDYSTLTMDALLQKMDLVQERLAYASMFGSGSLTDNLMHAKIALEAEIDFRVSLDAGRDRVEMSKAVIETDPDLAALYKKEVEKEDAPEVTQETRRRPATRRVLKMPPKKSEQ